MSQSMNDWVCKVCGIHFETQSELHTHTHSANHKSKPTQNKSLHTCEFCDKNWVTTESGYKSHVNYCANNPNKLDHKLYNHSDEAKKQISDKRKEYLRTHPSEHVWKRHSKFISVPCEDLKKFLISKKYNFIEEASIIPDRNFSVDICFPDKMIAIEVNGNQHYEISTMELKPYYQERHNLLSSFGWTVIEVPYNKAYSEEFRSYLCHLLDTNELISFDYKQECINIHERAKRKRDAYAAKIDYAAKNGTLSCNGKLSGNKVSIDELNRRKSLIINSGVDLTKFGWVSKVSEVSGLSRRIIYLTVNHFDDLKSIIFRRNS